MTHLPRLFLTTSLALTLACAADGDANDEVTASDGAADESSSAGDGGSETGAGTASIFAMMTQVYNLDDRTVYVIVTEGLDFDALSIDNGREFPGVANMAAVDGKLMISSGEQPVIDEFEITDDLQWQPARSLSFGSYPLSDNANFYYHFILDADTAYLPYEVTKRIVWNPSAFEIVGTVEDTNLQLERDGLTLEPSGNRNAVRFSDKVFQAFFYHDADWFQHGTSSAIAVYDPETNAETAVIDAACPGLAIATQDEDGNVYFGSWSYTGIMALYDIGAAPCAVRVKPDLTIDETFTTDFTEWTDGRYVSNFRYVGGGKAIGNVLHHEELVDADFTGEYDPAVADQLWLSGPQWKLWVFDVEAKTAVPLAGVDVDVGVIAQFAVLEGRTFVFLPYDDAARSKVYEVDLASATATERADVAGDLWSWIQVR